LRKNDPLNFSGDFAKLFSIVVTEKSIDFRAEILKYTGFALMTPCCSILFNLLTDWDGLVNKFNVITFILSVFFLYLGIECILRALDILEELPLKDK
jgi:hypothetical protein